MSDTAVTLIEGRVKHRTSNALQITFHAGPGEPVAVGVQSAGDGRGRRLGVLFGFKNGGTGNHQLHYPDGRVVGVASRDGAPSQFTTASGSPLATVHRGDASSAVLPDGRELFWFTADPDEPVTADLYRLRVAAPDHGEIGRLDVIRRAQGWSVMRTLDAIDDFFIWMDRAGQPLPIPIHGTRLWLTEPITDVQRDVLLAACVDIAIGLRPYVAAMDSRRSSKAAPSSGQAADAV